jgi:hypothetical protein
MSDIFSRYRRVVLWGLQSEGGDSFRHIHRHYAHALERLGKDVIWTDDDPEQRELLEPGDLVFAVDIAARQLGHPVPEVDYVLHNFPPSHPVWDGLEEERLLRLQVYTCDAERYGVEWDMVRRYDRAGRILFQPWGTDLLADEFLAPVFNERSREVPFVGSIWEGDGQGNLNAIHELKAIVDAHRLVFRHYVHISDEENVTAVRTGRIAPAVAGAWQCEQDYLPCRVFKNVSYGALALTNVPKFRDLFAGCFVGRGSVSQIVTEALELGEEDYCDLVYAQQEVVKRYTYREALLAIDRALEEGR